MKVVSVRRADNPYANFRKDEKGDILRDDKGEPVPTTIEDIKYQAGVYKVTRRKRDGLIFFVLVDKIGNIFKYKRKCVRKARIYCKENKDSFIYIDGVRQYTRVDSLPDDLATFLDFEFAIEESKNETA